MTNIVYTHTHTHTHTYIYIYIYIYYICIMMMSIYIIIILSCLQHEYLLNSLATHPYRSSLLPGPLGYIPCHRVAVCSFEIVALGRPYAGVHWRTSVMSSSLILQQCSACLIRQTLIFFVMGGRWPYRCCFGGVLSPGLVQKLLGAFLRSYRQAFSPSG